MPRIVRKCRGGWREGAAILASLQQQGDPKGSSAGMVSRQVGRHSFKWEGMCQKRWWARILHPLCCASSGCAKTGMDVKGE